VPAPSTSFAPAPSWGTTPIAPARPMTSSTGKPMPMQPDQPEL
jgi:hypothetical protein